MSKKSFFILTIFMVVSFILHLVGIGKTPPCLNADEAALGYNAYSILKTGKDEYGNFLPLRLLSFQDYKLPIYSYLSLPFIAIFGLNEFSTRVLNILLGALFVPLTFIIIKKLFKDSKIALIGSFLTSVSPWIHLLSHHAHEGVSATFFILLSFYFLVRYLEKNKITDFFLSNLFIFLSTFAYHFGRIFLFFFVLYQLYFLLRNKKQQKASSVFIKISTLIIISLIPLIIDISTLNRVNRLVFYQNPGFQLRLDEYLREHNLRLLHNKLTEAIRSVSYRYLKQISPEFLVISGDKNWRFGFENLGPITIVEYVFIFIGLYYLFRNKEKYRFLILYILAVSPLANALTWQEYSLIRTYPLIFPLIFIISYGFYYFLNQRVLRTLLILSIFFFYLINSWDIYLLHYPKRAEVIRAWQCGYKELVNYVKNNYSRFDKFVITDKLGQPYIFFLFYTQYDPIKYQKQAKISEPDGYGFGQISHFDKFYFKFSFNPQVRKTVFVGYPEDFKDLNIKEDRIKKIKIRTEEIFWIYEVF